MESENPVSQRQLAIFAFLLAACSLVYELAIAKTLSHLTGNAILWESITIGIYIAGLGIGTWLLSKYKVDEPTKILLRVELALSLVGAMSVMVILIWHMAYRVYLYDFGRLIGTGIIRPIVWFGSFGQVVTLVVGILSGLELPLLLAISDKAGFPGRYGRMFGFHYIGALAGTLVFGLWFMPYSTAGSAAIAAAAVNLVLCILLVRSIKARLPGVVGYLAFSASTLIAAIYFYPVVKQLQIKNFYYNNLSWTSEEAKGVTVEGPVGFQGILSYLRTQPDVERVQTHMQSIDILKIPPHSANERVGLKARPESFSVALDGAFQFNSETEIEYHEHITHIPTMLFRRPPTNALVLGGGDGLLVREVLRYGSLSSVTLVEIDPGMLRFAKTDPRMTALNLNSLDQPKVHVIIDDAFSWLRSSQKKFDVIYIDFPYPFSFDSLRLYSVEFLKLVSAHLLPEGYIVMDVPLDLDGVEFGAFNEIVFNTVRAAGFQTMIAFQSENETFITAATGLPVIYPNYIEFGFTPKTFGPNWFEKGSINLREIRNQPVSDRVNSIVRPRWLTDGNPRF